MATVPIQTTPSVQLSAQGPGQVQAGPDVQAVQNFAPEQIQKQGATMTKAANMVASISTKLQDDYNDARAKQLYNNYSREVTELQLQFSQRQGVNALGTSFDGSVSALDDLRQQYMAEADNDRIGLMFDQRAQVLMTSSAQSMTSHSLREGRSYAQAESRAEVANNIETAARNWSDYQDPDGSFNTFTSGAIAQVNDLADNMGLAQDSHQREQMVRGAYQDLHSSVIFNMAQEDKYIEAQAYLEDAWQSSEIGVAEYQRLTQALEQGRTREEGIDFGQRVFNGAAAQGNPANLGTFEQSLGHVLMVEGGYVADDAGAGPTKYGINGQANGLTDAEVASLTQAQAIEIYRQKYWNPMNMDSIQPEARMIVMDAAVNQGPGAARIMVREATRADGTLNIGMFADLRRARYQSTLENNSRFQAMSQEERDMYGRAWQSRVDNLAGGFRNGAYVPATSSVSIDAETGLPNLNQMVRHIRSTENDPGAQDIAIAQVTQMHREADLAQAQEYRNDLTQAEDVAFARIGGWQDISAELLGRIKPGDMARLREGENRGDDPDTRIKLIQNPELVRMAPRDANGNRIPGEGGIEDYRLMLSEPTYRAYLSAAMTPPDVDAPNNFIGASADVGMLNATLLRAQYAPDLSGVGTSDIEDLVNPQSDADKETLIRLTELWRTRIDEAQIELGNVPVSRERKQRILDNILLDRVYQDDNFGSTFTRTFELDNDALPYAYVVVPGADGSASEQLLVSNIPAEQTTLIIDAFRNHPNSGAILNPEGQVVRRGRYPTTQEIALLWVEGGRKR